MKIQRISEFQHTFSFLSSIENFDRITNYKIVSQIRCELAACLDIDLLQKRLYENWSDYIENPDQVTVDATCYESDLQYPSNQKLLWEAVNWM